MDEGYYAHPVRYDAEYASFTADVGFYLSRARAAAGRVLELGCGTGRVLLPLARAGLPIDGLDSSEPMLEALRRVGPPSSTRLHLADMRDFELPESYRLVIAPLNALMHLLCDDDLRACLRCVRRCLAPGGRLLFDVHNPIPELLRPSPPEGTALRNLVIAGEWFAQREFFSYDDTQRIGDIVYRFEPLRGGESLSTRLRLRYYPPEALDALLAEEGFALRSRQGGFSGEPFFAQSLTQVVEAEPGNLTPRQ
ncbi:MAG: class I SAM-dependent methyltransferase [Myxococcales bacterium]|nr:class I SAM-dependent methyltransferase [Myxococcales bacterium]